jgi:hypothetical protein
VRRMKPGMSSSVSGTSSTLAGSGGNEKGVEAGACWGSVRGEVLLSSCSESNGAASCGLAAGDSVACSLRVGELSGLVTALGLFSHAVIEDWPFAAAF